MRMDLVIRVGLVIVLLGIGRVRAEYSDVEKALIANRLLSLLQGQREMIQRQVSELNITYNQHQVLHVIQLAVY